MTLIIIVPHHPQRCSSATVVVVVVVQQRYRRRTRTHVLLFLFVLYTQSAIRGRGQHDGMPCRCQSRRREFTPRSASLSLQRTVGSSGRCGDARKHRHLWATAASLGFLEEQSMLLSVLFDRWTRKKCGSGLRWVEWVAGQTVVTVTLRSRRTSKWWSCSNGGPHNKRQ